MTDSTSRLFSIPASVPFLPALVEALTGRRPVAGFPTAGDPAALADVTLYLPTRRAGRLVQDALLDVLGSDAAILPRVIPIGDVDEDEIVFAHFASGGLARDALDLPPAVAGLERELLLAVLILKWATTITPRSGTPLVANTPHAALTLASDLARLIDDMTTRQVDWGKLDTLVPSEHDRYWDLTLDFLKIARTAWPARLNELGAIDAADRRDRLIEAELRRLKAHAGGPVIAAGSTGSMPSTAKLLAAVAALPNGAVVLPGLDTDLDEASWKMIAEDNAPPGHPQFALARLLEQLGVSRTSVTVIAPPSPHGREAFVSEAMRPAAATERWQEKIADRTFARETDKALSTFAVIEAANPEEEALSIAVALREAAETPSRTAALITPDRTLARRVLAALKRWNIAVDDSGGGPLSETPAGIFARLAADAAIGGSDPATLLALLKHPACRIGRGPDALADATSALERAVLRGPRPRPGTAGLRHALETLRKNRAGLHPRDPRAALTESQINAALGLVADLTAALSPLELIPARPVTLAQAAGAHLQIVTALRNGSETYRPRTEDGADALALLFEELNESETAPSVAISLADYPEIFTLMTSGRVVRRPGAPGARVRIFGPLEARLQQADRVILGGLNEGIWPPETQNDPWLSRPMRRELGLDLPERRIGLSAHDFTQALGAPEVIATRAAKVAGAPAVASRFLQRLAAVSGEERWGSVLARGEIYRNWSRALDRPAAVTPAPQPQPTPPRAIRPTRLSVTEIEHWLRDPYTIYAKHILKLVRLDPVGMLPSPAERGTAIHAAVDAFTARHRETWPADALTELLALGRQAFVPLEDYPEARAFWWPRFERIARWFVIWDNERRTELDTIFSEVRGSIPVTDNFTLTARIDRLEKRKNGRYAVLDYKTGYTPSAKQVRIGIAPQLTLEAAILRNGGFDGIAAGASVNELAYVRLKGGDTGGEAEPLDLEQTPDEAADHAFARLRTLVTRFDNDIEPYRALVLPMWKNRYGTYDDLARVKEWSAISTGDGGEE